MVRIQADASPDRWVAMTGSIGLKGRRHRKAAIRMLMTQMKQLTGMSQPAGRVFPWMISQVTPFLLRRAEGRMLVWMWKADPELLVAMAQMQEATHEFRVAQASRPIEHDDTTQFHNPHLGVGERLVVADPDNPRTPPFASYLWDQGDRVVMLSAVCSDRTRFGTVIGALDELARTLRVVEDLTLDEHNVLRIDPS